jgi:hypothetical protein
MSKIHTQNQWRYSVVDVSADSTTVYTGRCLIKSVWVTVVLSAHVLPILDGSTTLWNFAASSAVGTKVDFGDHGFVLNTSLVVDPDNAATGTIIVVWRPA